MLNVAHAKATPLCVLFRSPAGMQRVAIIAHTCGNAYVHGWQSALFSTASTAHYFPASRSLVLELFHILFLCY